MMMFCWKFAESRFVIGSFDLMMFILDLLDL